MATCADAWFIVKRRVLRPYAWILVYTISVIVSVCIVYQNKQGGYFIKDTENRTTKDELFTTTKVISTGRPSTSLELLTQYSYQAGSNGSTTGKTFDLSASFKSEYGFLLKDFVDASSENAMKFVFVMGVSSSHFPESKDAIASVQQHFPNRRIIYYDWGLQGSERDTLKTWCDVELRPFNFSAVPYLSGENGREKWHYQVAKAFVITKTLKQHPAIMWIDTSIRFHNGHFTPVYKLAQENSGVVFFDHNAHSTFAVTPPDMYKYLPTSEDGMKSAAHVQTGAVFLMRSQRVCKEVLWWFLLCCHQRDCIFSPGMKYSCAFQGTDRHLSPAERGMIDKFNGCSRYDQSVMNILVGNMFNFDANKYCIGICHKEFFTVARRGTAKYNLKLCKN